MTYELDPKDAVRLIEDIEERARAEERAKLEAFLLSDEVIDRLADFCKRDWVKVADDPTYPSIHTALQNELGAALASHPTPDGEELLSEIEQDRDEATSAAGRLYAKLVRAEQRVTDLKLVKKAESRRADHAESERDSRLVREWLRSPEALTIATDAWRRNVPGSQGENVLADVLAALAATPDTPASPPRYSTEQARMRLREVLTTAEWPEDGTAEEYFIREVFPDDGEPDGPASPVLGDEERERRMCCCSVGVTAVECPIHGGSI